MNYDKAYLQSLINGKIEESISLDYKAAEALQQTDGKKKEITKDVSALANAAGGMIIYGIKESPLNKRLPDSIEPITDKLITKEWLDIIIGLIKPRIEGLIIHPVFIGPEDHKFCFIVEVPQSNRAHQSTDYRYYKRRNFESSPMEDYEIKDVLNRQKNALLSAQIRITSNFNGFNIEVKFINTSHTMAKHYAAEVYLPYRLKNGVHIRPKLYFEAVLDGLKYNRILVANIAGVPLFPNSYQSQSREYELFKTEGFLEPEFGTDIKIILHADNAPPVYLTKNADAAYIDWT